MKTIITEGNQIILSNMLKNLFQILLIVTICVLGWACGGNNQTSDNSEVKLVDKDTELANKEVEPQQMELDTSEVDADNTSEVQVQKGKTVTRVIEGTISGYVCGDNCYLTITDKKGKSHSGGCSAPICDKWNWKAGMPKSYIGMRVKVSISYGKHDDGTGNDVESLVTKIQFLK